jgi:hypothetical protein
MTGVSRWLRYSGHLPIIMKKVEKMNPIAKMVWILEADPVRRDEILEAFSGRTDWKFRFFGSWNEIPADTGKELPIAFIVDLQHVDASPEEDFDFSKLEAHIRKHPGIPVLVFCDSGHEKWAAKSLTLGVRDYVILNEHQFIKLEYELVWLEETLDKERQNQKEKRFLYALLAFLVLFMVLIVVLYYAGYLKEGTDTHDILLEN